MAILVVGGAGYIGSHTCVQLLEAGFEIVVVDNLSNSSPASLRRVTQITGRDFPFVHADIRDKNALRTIFQTYEIQAVIHFAGLKAVGESSGRPLRYYDNNVSGSLALFEVMTEANVKSLVFSSSATVYGESANVPIKESFSLSATNPYGRTKLMIEDILRDLQKSDNTWRISLLRYFNPIGAHESGLIGENPNGIPNNLLPYVTQVAVGRLPELRVFGNDYPTPDGTGVRDYIHVMDIADGHIAALRYLFDNSALVAINLGTGNGYSVLEVVKTFSEISGKEIPYQIMPRRAGDVAINFADVDLARNLIGWIAKRNLSHMCQDAWRWQTLNPNGYMTN